MTPAGRRATRISDGYRTAHRDLLDRMADPDFAFVRLLRMAELWMEHGQDPNDYPWSSSISYVNWYHMNAVMYHYRKNLGTWIFVYRPHESLALINPAVRFEEMDSMIRFKRMMVLISTMGSTSF